MTNDPSPAGIHHVRVTQTESPCVLRQSSSLMPSDCMDTCLSKLVCSLLSLSAAQVSKFNNWTPSFGDFLHVYIFFFLCCLWCVAMSFDIVQSWFCANRALHRKMHWPIIYVWEPRERLAGCISYRTSLLHQDTIIFIGWNEHIEWDFWCWKLMLLADRMSLVYVHFSLLDLRSINDAWSTLAQIR